MECLESLAGTSLLSAKLEPCRETSLREVDLARMIHRTEFVITATAGHGYMTQLQKDGYVHE
jgi:hypothetical protein